MSDHPINRRCFGVIAAELLMVLTLPACAPVFSSYQYISLTGYPDAKVEKMASASPGEGGWFMGDIPVRYTIEREDYTLTLQVDPTWKGPAIGVIVNPATTRVLDLGPRETWHQCISWRDPRRNPVGWTLGFGCDPNGANTPTELFIRFKVTDRDANLIGEEAIPFEVIERGGFVYFDAI
jgi:hypothetical protein